MSKQQRQRISINDRIGAGWEDLYLPHMPSSPSAGERPSIRLLVCADVDLQSSSALSEYMLQQKLFDPSTIDMVLVAGPLTSAREETSFLPITGDSTTSNNTSTLPPYVRPFLETPEQTAARLGMVTACLSQLENIVCRVAYLPGTSDPRTATTLRLTPNSRCLQGEWLRLAPGLGCGGLTYIQNFNNIDLQSADPTQQQTLDTIRLVRGDTDGDDPAEEEENTSSSSDQANIFACRTSNLLERYVYATLSLKSFNNLLIGSLSLIFSSHHDYDNLLGQILSLAREESPCCDVDGSSDNEQPPQTILVTEFVNHHHKEHSRGSDHATDNDRDDDSKAATAYIDQHSAFFDSHPETVCFEITTAASLASSPNREAQWIAPQLLYPGSLRENGEFVLVSVELLEQPQRRWSVQKSQFHHLHILR